MKKIIFLFTILIAVIISCKSNSSNGVTSKLNVTFEPKSSSNVDGTGIFSEKNGQVTFTANFTGLKPGIHAIHIHEKFSRWSLESNF